MNKAETKQAVTSLIAEDKLDEARKVLSDYLSPPKQDSTKFIEEEIIRDWEHLKEVIDFYATDTSEDLWIFRGQSDYRWKLSTGIERLNLAVEEPKIIDDFQRNAHLYTDTSRIKNTVEWLSVMQHHGTPTRLLDWTFSPYIAIFFAINDVKINIHNDKESYSAVYALNYKSINLKLKHLYKDDETYKFLSLDNFIFNNTINDNANFECIFFSEFMEGLKEFPPTVIPLIPFNSHIRLKIQQGLFLCPTQIINTFTFEKNLEQTLEGIFDHGTKKYLIPTELKPTIITELNYMNINDATLFPSIDGYSRFLKKKHSLRNEKNEVDAIKMKRQYE